MNCLQINFKTLKMVNINYKKFTFKDYNTVINLSNVLIGIVISFLVNEISTYTNYLSIFSIFICIITINLLRKIIPNVAKIFDDIKDDVVKFEKQVKSETKETLPDSYVRSEAERRALNTVPSQCKGIIKLLYQSMALILIAAILSHSYFNQFSLSNKTNKNLSIYNDSVILTHQRSLDLRLDTIKANLLLLSNEIILLKGIVKQGSSGNKAENKKDAKIK